MNEAGWIVGYGLVEGRERAFLLIPEGARLEPPRPGRAGEHSEFVVRGVEPGAEVVYAYSFSLGETSVPGCPGLTVSLRRPTVFGQATANANGMARLVKRVPGAAAGRAVHFQAVDRDGCVATNVVDFTFE